MRSAVAPRYRSRWAAFALAVGTGLVAQPAAQQGSRPAAPAASIVTLTADTPVERELKPGDTHAYAVDLAAGGFVSILVEQLGIDVAVALTGAAGEVVALNAMDDEFRPEHLAAVAETAGRYDVRISSALPKRQGRYRVRLNAARAPTADDLRLVAAERAFADGRRRRDPSKAPTWPEALTHFQAALDGFTAVANRAGEMKTRLEIGITENYMSQPQALESARVAVTLAREVNEPAAAARALRLSGNILVARGEYSGAVEALDEAAAIGFALGHRNSEARSVNDAAIGYRRLGRVERAVELYERALVLARATSDGAIEANILNNLGVAYKTLGDFDRALDFYGQSLANRLAANDRRGQYHANLNLSNLQRLFGNYPLALDHATTALSISRGTGDRTDEAQALNAQGNLYLARGDSQQALETHRLALTIAREIGDLDQESSALSATARALLGLKRLDEAALVAREGLALSVRMRSSFGERNDLADLASIERARGDLAEASRLIADSIALDEKLRTGISSPELRASFVAAEQDRYSLWIDILQQRHAAAPADGHEARAFEVSERARARVLLDSLLNGGVDLREGVAPDLLERERSLQKRLRGASERVSEVVASNKPEAERAEAADAVARLTRDLEQVRAEIRRRSPRYAELTQPAPLSAAAIQRDVLDADTVLLEFSIGEDRSWLWAVTPESLTSVALPPQPVIEAAGRRFYETLTARKPRDGETQAQYRARVAAADARRPTEARALSEMLLGGIGDRLRGDWRGKRLAIVTSGVLDLLPFTALPIPGGAASAPLLSRTHDMVRLPSASVIAATRRDDEGRAPAAKTLAILADPVFESDDPRLPADIARGAAAKLPAEMRTASVVSRHALGRAGVGRLPFSREEADGVAALVPRNQVFKATDFEATRDAAVGTALSGYRIVHFATHGVFDSERPALSGLVFSLVDRRGKFRDGYLRLHDVYNLRLNAELVVLSACETALGKHIGGEGLMGLARAFMYAGAPRVVASLWEVSDVATAELMKRFYRAMLQDGLPAAAALHAAQRQMQADPRWREPFYWAGFTLVGDWR